MALNKQNMRADCPKDKLEFKIFFKHCIGSIFHLFPMKEDGGHAHNIAKRNPLPQLVIDSPDQECVFLNNLHTACLRYPFIHLGEETKWTNVSCLRKQHDSKA